MLTQVKIVKKITGLLLNLRVRTVKTSLFMFLFLIAVTVTIGQAASGTMADSINRTSTEHLSHNYDPAFAENMSLFDLDVSWQSPRAILAGITTRVSVASDGTEGNSNSNTPAISADGRYVSFQSEANNLVPGDTNGAVDIFVHDRQTGQTSRVSLATDGTQGNWHSLFPSISADGRYVAFRSAANNLVPGDTNSWPDIFVHDRQTGQTSRVSLATDGMQGNGDSNWPSISDDGRYVAFYSEASNLTLDDTNDVEDVFVHDRQTGETSRISVATDGTQGNSLSGDPSISADGRYVAFASLASNLTPGDTNGEPDIFVHDRQTGQTSRVSVAADGMQANGSSERPSISADGRYVAFHSVASNLIPADTNGTVDIFVHDRQTGQTSRVSVAADGTQGMGYSGFSSISADGRYVSFLSAASNLIPGDTNNQPDIFVHDRQTGQINHVSVASDGTQGNAPSGGVHGSSISDDGRYIAFESEASNLVPDDTNGVSDVFVHDRGFLGSQLNINYLAGAPGSYFTLYGHNFGPDTIVTVTVNGVSLGTVTTDGSGAIQFLLSTANADEGTYFVTATGGGTATVGFMLDAGEPLQPQEGTEPILNVPAGIAFTEFVFLPLVQR
jgi:Tol biopolymer transport system component